MGLAGFTFTLLLLLVNLLMSIRLANRLTSNATYELVLLVAGVCLWLIALLGLALHKRWGWKLNLVLFSFNLTNLVWVYSLLGSSLTLAFAFGVNVVGWLVSILGVDLYIPENDEFAEEPVQPEVAESKPVTKKKKKKRSK